MDWKKLVSKFGGEDDQGEMAVSASVRSDPDDPVYAISGKQQ
mgnify:CR=1 FL=1